MDGLQIFKPIILNIRVQNLKLVVLKTFSENDYDIIKLSELVLRSFFLLIFYSHLMLGKKQKPH